MTPLDDAPDYGNDRRAGRCEICTSTDDIYVHHVARLKDLNTPGPQLDWAKMMAKRRRKTLVVCRICYDSIRSGLPRTQ